MRELLGELLLEMGQPAAALSEFEAALKANPNRYRAFWGAARAADAAGDRASATAYYAKLLDLSKNADTERRVWPWLSSFESPAHPVKSLTQPVRLQGRTPRLCLLLTQSGHGRTVALM
jgi:tetratricopeptide (TPR) repeat protein